MTQEGIFNQLTPSSAVTSITGISPIEANGVSGIAQTGDVSVGINLTAIGTVTNFSFTNANGFSGVVTNPTTTPNLTLTTTVTNNQVIFASSGALTGDADLTYDPTLNVLNVGNATSSSNGTIIVGGSGTGIGNVTGGGGALNVIGGDLTLASNPTHFVRILTNTIERLRVLNDGTWQLASDPGTSGFYLGSNGAGTSPTWKALSSGAVTSITGTANQILANGTSGTPQIGAVTLTFPTTVIVNTLQAQVVTISGATNSILNLVSDAASTATDKIFLYRGAINQAWVISNNLAAAGNDEFVIQDNAAVNRFKISQSAGSMLLNPSGGQVIVNSTSLNSSAAFGVVSTTQGMLPPVMTTTQKNAISGPTAGLVVYDSVLTDLQFYNGATWIGASTSGVTSIAGTANQIVASASTGAVTLSFPATGGLSIGSYQATSPPTGGMIMPGSLGVGATSFGGKFWIVDSAGGAFFDGSGGTYASANRWKSTTTSAGTGRDLVFTTDNAGTNSALYINTSAQAGLGISTGFTDQLNINSSSTSSGIALFASGSVKWSIRETFSDDSLRFGDTGAVRVTFANGGNVAFGTTTTSNIGVTITNANSGNFYQMLLNGTFTANDGSNQYGLLNFAVFNPTNNTTNVWAQYISPNINVPSSRTVTSAAGLSVNTTTNSTVGTITTLYKILIGAGTGGSGTISTSYGLYVNAPTDATTTANNITAFFAGNTGFFGTSFAGGTNVIAIANRSVAPAGTPTGGGVLYSNGGAGTWKGSGGTVTAFGPAEPHCPICGSDFGWQWEHPKYGGRLQICAQCFVQELGDRPYIRWSRHPDPQKYIDSDEIPQGTEMRRSFKPIDFIPVSGDPFIPNVQESNQEVSNESL